MKTKTALLALALLLPEAGRAQKPPEPPRVAGAVETSILELDAVVTDKQGRPVSGLKASDFEVKIGGKPVPIENFHERRPSAPAPAASVPAPAAPVLEPVAPARAPRHLVLFLDRLHLVERWKADATFDALRRTLRAVVSGPGDDAMLVTWDRSVRTVVPFTPDLARIERVLAEEQRLSRSAIPEEATAGVLKDEQAWFQRVAADIAARGGNVPQSFPTSGAEMSRRTAQAEAYAAMRAKAGALKAVCAAVGGMPGRKILVHASHRFSRVAGLEFSENPLDAQEFNATATVESVAESANANGVTMYTIFPEGWNENLPGAPVVGLSDAAVLNEAAALESLAERTGGTFSLGWREAPALAQRIATDVDGSYSLGVAAPGGKPGKALAVKVSVRDPALIVRARQAAVERSPEERLEARVLSNLFRPEPPSRLAIVLDAARVEGSATKPTAGLSVRIPISGLVKAPTKDGAGGTFSVFVASASADGAFSDVARQRRPYEIPRADLAAAENGHFTYELSVALGASAARISVGVWDEVGKDAGFLLVEVRDGQAAVRR